MIGRCNSVNDYERICPIGEGTYGKVFKARHKKTGEVVALKKILIGTRECEGFPETALREIRILESLNHQNIVELKDVVLEARKRKEYDTYLVFGYCNADLSMLDKLSRAETKGILQQLLKGLDFLHTSNFIHRDIKLQNLFLDKEGILKIGDFGLARDFELPPSTLTPDLVTLWYRAPELLFGLKNYTTAVDIWAVGCVMGELLLSEPLLPGTTEELQIKMICNFVGVPTSRIWPGVEKLPNFNKYKLPMNPYNNLIARFPRETINCRDLLSRLLICDPSKRITARQALKHPYFNETPSPKLMTGVRDLEGGTKWLPKAIARNNQQSTMLRTATGFGTTRGAKLSINDDSIIA